MKKLIEIETKKTPKNSRPLHVTDATFNATVKKSPAVLIDFFADWCGPCKALTPRIEEIAEKYRGELVFGKLDIDRNPKTADNLDVSSIPTLLLFKDGKEVDRIVGSVPKSIIEKTIKQVFKPELEGVKKNAKT